MLLAYVCLSVLSSINLKIDSNKGERKVFFTTYKSQDQPHYHIMIGRPAGRTDKVVHTGRMLCSARTVKAKGLDMDDEADRVRHFNDLACL